jgi:hypothetical protein
MVETGVRTLFVPRFMADIQNENSTLTLFMPFLSAFEAELAGHLRDR